MSSWYCSNETQGIAVSTRVRLARNLTELPFPSKMTVEQSNELKQKVKSAVEECNMPFAKELKFIDMKTVPSNEVLSLVERHIISPEFCENPSRKAIILSADESISIMIGEEDHLRIQVILPGLSLKEAYNKAEEIDSALFSKLKFAFDNELGFLTECPTNLGTGLRASIMLHLPVCESTGEVARLSETIGKIGFTVRGLYGEGSKSEASLYQVSNQITLGISESNAIDNLAAITNQIIEKENASRQKLDSLKLEDLCMRALGILSNCRVLSSNEMMNLLSRVKLGINTGIIKREINPIKMLIEGQPHMIMKKFGEMSADERDIARASFIREALQ